MVQPRGPVTAVRRRSAPVLATKPIDSYRAIAGALSTSNLHVGARRAVLGGPGQQRRAQWRARGPGAAARRPRAPPTCRPAGAVGRGGDRTACRPRRRRGVANVTSPSSTAVNTSTGTSRGRSRSHVASGRRCEVHRASGRRRRGRSRTMTIVSTSAGVAPGSVNSRSGTASRASARVRAYQSTIAGSARQLGTRRKRHSRIGAMRVAVRPAQQPAVDPLLLGPRPRQGGGVLDARIWTCAPERRQRPHRDHVGGGDLTTSPRFVRTRRIGARATQMSDHIGQRRRRTGRAAGSAG